MYSFCKRRRAPCDRVRDSLRRKKKLPFTVHTWKNPMSPLVVHFVVGDAAPHFWVFLQFCPSHLQFLGIFTQFCLSPPQKLDFCWWSEHQITGLFPCTLIIWIKKSKRHILKKCSIFANNLFIENYLYPSASKSCKRPEEILLDLIV